MRLTEQWVELYEKHCEDIDKTGNCWVCGDETTVVDWGFDAFCCSPVCMFAAHQSFGLHALKSDVEDFMMNLPEALFFHIKHGDDEHQEWLRRESYAFLKKYAAEQGVPEEWIPTMEEN